MPQLDFTVFALAVGTLFFTFLICLALVRFSIHRMVRVRVARFYTATEKFVDFFKSIVVSSYTRRFLRSGRFALFFMNVARSAFCYHLCAIWPQSAIERADKVSADVFYPLEQRLAAHRAALASLERL